MNKLSLSITILLFFNVSVFSSDVPNSPLQKAITYYQFRNYTNNQWVFLSEIEDVNLNNIKSWFYKLIYNDPSKNVILEFYLKPNDLAYRCAYKSDGFSLVYESIFVNGKEYIYRYDNNKSFELQNIKNKDGSIIDTIRSIKSKAIYKKTFMNPSKDIYQIIYYHKNKPIRTEKYNDAGLLLSITDNNKDRNIIRKETYNPKQSSYESLVYHYSLNNKIEKIDKYINTELNGYYYFDKSLELSEEVLKYKDFSKQIDYKIRYCHNIFNDNPFEQPEFTEDISFNDRKDNKQFYEIFIDNNDKIARYSLNLNNVEEVIHTLDYDLTNQVEKETVINSKSNTIVIKLFNQIEEDVVNEPENLRKNLYPSKYRPDSIFQIERYSLEKLLISLLLVYYNQEGQLNRVETYNSSKLPIFVNFYSKDFLITQHLYNSEGQISLIKEFSPNGEVNSTLVPNENDESLKDYHVIKELPLFEGDNPHSASINKPQSLEEFLEDVKKKDIKPKTKTNKNQSNNDKDYVRENFINDNNLVEEDKKDSLNNSDSSSEKIKDPYE